MMWTFEAEKELRLKLATFGRKLVELKGVGEDKRTYEKGWDDCVCAVMEEFQTTFGVSCDELK